MSFLKRPIYQFSPDTVQFTEIRFGRSKLLVLGALLGFCSLISLYFINQYNGDFLGLAYLQQNALVHENRILHDQLLYLSSHLDKIQKSLDNLSEQGNEFRLLVNLPKVDEDIQKAGVGGTEERIDFSSSTEINDLLNNLRLLTNKAERELRLQKTSYDAVLKSYDQNKIRFAHLPAMKPMEGYFSPESFGIRFHPILHIYRMHEGIDITNEAGTPVYATADGVVDFTGRQVGLGIVVEINHGYSLKSVYGHLSKILVREGQTIKRGDLIARSGNTGLSSGPHLHYEIRLNGVAQNPIDYFFNDVDHRYFQQPKK